MKEPEHTSRTLVPRHMAMLIAVLCAAFTHVGQANGAHRLPPETVRDPATAAIDKETDLPVRVLHKPSGIALVLIPAGEFEMGKPEGANQERRHRRIIRRPFYLSEAETTVAQFRRFVDDTEYTTDAERGAPEEPDKTVGAFAQIAEVHRRRWSAEAQWRNPFPEFAEYKLANDHPVVQVSWNDARAFCDHFGLNLPTEIQWEYACRAGATTRFPWGDAAAGFRGRDNGADASTRRLLTGDNDFFTFDDGHPLLAPVRSFEPNAYGVFGMMGNVAEWCANGFSALIPTEGADEAAPEPAPDEVRALRGGTWFTGTNGTSCADRFGMRPQSRRDFIGFRVCLEIPAE